jgi:pimeloyl-ACP methyl ester carboxylesterase
MPTAQTSGITTYYKISGNGPPPVLIHGDSFELFDCFYDFDLTADLAKITAPTLIIVGERIKMVFHHAEKMHELIEHSAIVKIPDAFHITNLENPEQFNRAVEGFLAEI